MLQKTIFTLCCSILLSNTVFADICDPPLKPETNYDFDVKSDSLGMNQHTATDYFKLMLTWSPDYCQQKRDEIKNLNAQGKQDAANDLIQKNAFQCFAGNKFTWVVQGLWPASCDGKSLADCTDISDTRKHPRFCKGNYPEIPYTQIKPYLCISPSAAQLQNEWEKHGACDFRSATDYFKKTKELFYGLKRPKEKMDTEHLGQWMAENNPALTGKKLGFNETGLYVCYNTTFAVIDCPQKE